jgi:enamine deaminase RidA (YjgF/YER057c/UK114 family)
MSIATPIPTPLTHARDGYADFAPPTWVADVLGLRHESPAEPAENGLLLQAARTSSGHALVTARVPDALGSDAATFQRQVVDAYNAIRDTLDQTDAPHPVRFWNYVPGITERMPDGRDRYMTFNAGRFEAFCDWYGGPQSFNRLVPTASGVGHPGEDLVIHCLAAERPGLAIANPRQVQPFHYSQRFGPLPPCFARATLVRSPAPLLLVGGTASIRGEDSLHVLDFAGQMGETLANLAAMVHAATGRAGSFRAGDLAPLRRYRELRVYLPDANRARAVAEMISDLFPSVRHIEMLHADLCRPELLVEIEGIAELPSA